MKVCVITIARHEDEHIEEFCDHYFNVIGVDHIVWVDNNNPPLKPVVINDKRVTVVRKNHLDFGDGKKRPLDYQNECLNDALKKHVYKKFDCCIYTDVDELLDLNGVKIKKYISKLPEGFDYVAVRWVMQSNNYYIWDNDLPTKTMKGDYGWDTNHVPHEEYKAFFKVHKNSYIDIWYPYSRRTLPKFIRGHQRLIIDPNIRVHHYRVQCIEHYIRHKVKNGWYGRKIKPEFIKGLFNSAQFRNSNVKLKLSQYDDLMLLLKKYKIKLSKFDQDYLNRVFKR